MLEKITGLFRRKSDLEKKIDKAFELGDFISLLRLDAGEGIGEAEYLKLFYGWVFAAATTIAGDIAKLDRGVFDGKGERITTRYDEMISYSLIYSIVLHYVIFGVAHLWLVKGPRGNIIDLMLLRPDRFAFVYDEAGQKTGKVQYFLDNGKTLILDEKDIVTIRNIDPADVNNRFKGKSMIGAVVYSILTDIEASKWNYKFFKNGTWVGLVIESENILAKSTLERIKRELEQEYRGTENSNKLMILDGGMKINKIANTQKDIDFTEGKRLTRDEILAIMKVPKQILGLGEGNNLNVRYFEKIYAERTLLPIVKQIEDALNKSIFKGVGTFRFLNVLPLDREELRKDFESGLITINEYRERVGYARLNEGDVLLINGQMYEVTKEDSKKKVNKEIVKKISKELTKKVKELVSFENTEYWDKYFEGVLKQLDKYEKSFEKAIRGIWNRQEKMIINEVKMMVGKGLSKEKIKEKILDPENSMLLWIIKMLPIIEKIIANEYKRNVELIGPENKMEIFGHIDDWLKETSKELLDKMATQIDNTTRKKILEIVFDGIQQNKSSVEIIDDIKKQFKHWKETRLELIVRTETVRLQQEATVRSFKDLGITKKRWFTVADDRRCKFCAAMHGKEVYVDDYFARKGDVITADGKTMIVDYEDIKHPPLHPRCRCQLLPVL